MTDKTSWAGAGASEADINTYLTHTGGAWNSYTPSLSGISLGNGTLVGDYWRAGRFTAFKVKLTFGTTTSVSGAMVVGLPVAYADGTDAETFSALMYDASTVTRIRGGVTATTTTTVTVNALLSSGTYVSDTATSSTVPFTWTTSDILIVSGIYEAA